ncbi:MAG: hypothetical protein U0X73_10020 [Thermoanaerobaculia bacterium]
MSERHDHGPAGGAPGFDEEIDVRGIVKVGMWIAALTVGSFVAMYFTYVGIVKVQSKADPKPSPIATTLVVSPPGPRLQGSQFDPSGRQIFPERELQRMRAGEEKQLHSYGWVDKSAGYVHVPIERALELELARQSTPPAPAAPAVN